MFACSCLSSSTELQFNIFMPFFFFIIFNRLSLQMNVATSVIVGIHLDLDCRKRGRANC